MIRFWEGHTELSRQLQEVRETILRLTASNDPGVSEAVNQLMASSGKMLRPAFVLLASRFGAPDPARLVRVAAAVEMLHMATLVHDDIIDAAPLRRGAATLHVLRGPRTAVLAGDWLFATCFSLAADLGSPENGRALARLVARICASEISQSADAFAPYASVRRYLRRIAGKTAALFALSFHVGAHESGCPPQLVSLLRRLGYCLGMGFQIVDDILDYSADGAQTGKPSGCDLSQGIVTLPAVFALQDDDGRLARVIRRGRRSRRAVARAARMVRTGQGISRARSAAEAYTVRAMRTIDMLPSNEARQTLREITEALLHRTY